MSFSNAAKSHIFRKPRTGPMTGGSSEVEEGDAGECLCRIREPVSALDHTGKYANGTSCCHAKMSRVNIVHIVPGVGVVTKWSLYTRLQIIQILCNQCSSCQQSRYALPLSDMEAMFDV